MKEACLAVNPQEREPHRIIVAGIGPGNPDYMVPAARQAIAEARVLVGGRRALAQFARGGAEAVLRAEGIACVDAPAQPSVRQARKAKERASADGQALCAVTRDIDGVMAFIRTHLAFSDVVVMVSGDPGYFSLLDALRRTFPEELIDVIPGISAIQFAFARLALPWHDAELLSFHGRVPEDGALVYRAGRKLGLLTDQQYHSQAIAKILLEHGWPEASRYAICARLSYEDERIERMTLGEAARFAAVGSCVIVVEG